MPIVGLLSANGYSTEPEGLGHCSFEFALQEAATGDSEAFPYPYPLLKGIIDSIQNRDYISVTSILHCIRGEYLKRTAPYYVSVEKMYPMFRGTLFHGLLEANPNPNGRVEEEHKRTHRGVEIGGTFDSMVVMQDPDGTVILQDWKTSSELPKYNTPYSSHMKQINLYRWLLGLDPDKVIMEVWYFNMQGFKRLRLLNGKQVLRSGNKGTNHHWTDAQVEEFLDDKLVKLRASLAAKLPMPYVMVDDETKGWECALCPVAVLCEKTRYTEMRSVWRKEAGLPPESAGTIISIEDGITAKLDGPETAAEWGNVLDAYTRRLNSVFPLGTGVKAVGVDLAKGSDTTVVMARPVPAPKPAPRVNSRSRRKAAK